MKIKQTRRDFLKVSAAATAGMLLLGAKGIGAQLVDRKSFGVGLQLYSIRDAMTADVAGTLKKVSDLGYKYLELASYSNGKFYGYTPKEFKKMVSDLGMEIISSHTQVEAEGITLENAKKMANDHTEVGVKYCIQPWVQEKDRNIETYKKMVGEWNKVGKIMKEVGIQFGYHNHNFEFKKIDGIVPYYDIYMKELDPDLVTMEIDLFWVTKAGQNPVEMFKKYPGRFKLFHLKDMKLNNAPYFDIIKDDITSVGAGLIDFKSIIAAKETAGCKFMFVEDDNQGNGKPFEALETSISNLTTKILVK
jgi:sugar phosphate isomerase/epimerase